MILTLKKKRSSQEQLAHNLTLPQLESLNKVFIDYPKPDKSVLGILDKELNMTVSDVKVLLYSNSAIVYSCFFIYYLLFLELV